ncbi:MAG: hypothetical protein LBT27_07020 [Prevotellaceae bacterium]|jgi:hypothetical protein|nr:hypothetical protein [Prevotellaceae bacterium]
MRILDLRCNETYWYENITKCTYEGIEKGKYKFFFWNVSESDYLTSDDVINHIIEY